MVYILIFVLFNDVRRICLVIRGIIKKFRNFSFMLFFLLIIDISCIVVFLGILEVFWLFNNLIYCFENG